MIRLFAATAATERLSALVDDLKSHPQVEVIGKAHTGRDTFEAVRTQNFDALVMSEHLSDVARALRLSGALPEEVPPALVAASESPTPAAIVRSLAYGFDSILPVRDDSNAVVKRLTEIVDGRHRLAEDSIVADLGVPHALLARTLVVDEMIDGQIADLVGAGLDDHNIALVTSRSIQEIRNRIEGLLVTNDLATRTHLAVVRAAQIVVPDLA